MKISILIPVYNVKKWLDRCLDSLEAQTWKDWEAVLVNDGSTDASLEIAQRRAAQDARIHVFSYPNRGISVTRNRLLDHARGDAFLFVDSDDWIEPETLEKLVRVMEGKRCDIVQCGYQMDFGPVPFLRPVAGNGIHTREEALQMLVNNKGINNYPWGKLFRRHTFSNVRFPENIKGFEDTRTIFRTFLNASRIGTIPDRFVHYVQHPGSLTNCMSLATVYDMRRAYEYQENYLKKVLPHQHFDFNRNYYNTDMVIIYTLILFSHRKENPRFDPASIDWSKLTLSPVLHGAYLAWLQIACVKMGWDIRKVLDETQWPVNADDSQKAASSSREKTAKPAAKRNRVR
ncbi:glycosyltransferase family 2 protein [Faecalibaculum rodentium]|jgi:glycosyltransferase involved in cell wall biosynthesis|uniref:glycosyltransferase family 2 protein n=1 Tax=Faecalibaculum rodentium TaxID=1702221 RepID=UPI0023F1B3B6|nr:glycosyltransferase family 2 protein [Faecalibaculum rodentium]